MLINHSRIEQAMTYGEYNTLLETLIKINQTTGTNQSADMIEYAKLNLQRIHRLDKTTVVDATLQEKVRTISGKYIWLVLTEGWCGDASQILPVVNKIAELNPNIQLLFLLRDENLDIMDNYLTNGGRSQRSPRVIFKT
ncbi:MAG: thioredoxin family protein [Spirosomaceae bacterium]|nr:thioredoxin family protein [Spirosomataceae bacterium]